MNRFLFLPLIATLIGFGVLHPQQRYLVSPNQEVIRIGPGQSARSVIASKTHPRTTARQATCGNQFYFGYPGEIYPTTNNFGSYHSDVIGQWFVAPASGTIDTIFWQQWMSVGAYDSTVYLRVHESLIGPDYGPGVRPGPFSPPCQNWGYWMNTNDPDQGIAAFIEDATDTTWISTISGSPVPSTPHLGEELWGLGGYAVQVHAGAVNFVPMDALADTIGVTTGDKFFISFQIPPCSGGAWPPSYCHDWENNEPEVRTEWAAWSFRASSVDQDYPSRLWKFYEHDKGPSNCSGMPIDSVKRGWVARGGFTHDTLDVAGFNIWYSMTVVTNTPPDILDPDQVVQTFFDASPPIIGTFITDCDIGNPANSGVESAIVIYEIDGVLQPDLPMSYGGGDYWSCALPAIESHTAVTYRIKAFDLAGAFSITPPNSLTVVPFGGHWYDIDTALTCLPADISATGTSIDTSNFFDPVSPGAVDKDDGIAGPFDIGGTMRLFGEEYRYAWVSVDGAIGLGQTETDTAKIIRSAMFGSFLNLSAASPDPPIDPPVIAAMWDNFMVGDSSGSYGTIKYGNSGDPCSFIAQWDSIGISPLGNFLDAGPSFRIVLNRCLGTIEFQYKNTWAYGSDSLSIIGMQADPYATPGSRYVFVNRMGSPTETRPQSGSCIRFYPRNPEPEGEKWNLVSISVLPNDGDYSAANLFPGGPVSNYYTGIHEPLRLGRGYWMKKVTPGIDGAPGVFFDSVTVSVRDKWNLVGGTSGYVPTGSIVATGGTVSSSYFGYGTTGYYTATTLEPGKGYWVKMNGAGSLSMFSSAAQPKPLPGNGLSPPAGFTRMTTLKLSDASGRSQSLYLAEDASPSVGGGSGSAPDASMFELPPPPPGDLFDARFSSGRMLESYGVDGTTPGGVYPIAVSGGTGLVTIRWEVSGDPAHGVTSSLEVTREGVIRSYLMDKAGAITVDGPALLSVRVSTGKPDGLPSGFSLSSNYPNPFNPSTTIDYTLPVGSRVSLVVFNIAGEEVVRLTEGEMPAGYHSVSWDATSSPSGVYYCRMTAGTYRGVRKMLLLK